MIIELNIELIKVSKWLKANKLTLNLSKTHFMVFHRARIKHVNDFVVNIDDKKIDSTLTTKFLGIIIDNKLKWTEHIKYIKNKISKSIGIIYKCRYILNKNTLCNLYNSFILPYLNYGIEIWGTTKKTYIDLLLKSQKKIVQLISHVGYRAHTDPIFCDLN